MLFLEWAPGACRSMLQDLDKDEYLIDSTKILDNWFLT